MGEEILPQPAPTPTTLSSAGSQTTVGGLDPAGYGGAIAGNIGSANTKPLVNDDGDPGAKEGAMARRIANTYGSGLLYATVNGGVPGAELFNPIFVPDTELAVMRLDPAIGLGLMIWKATLFGLSYDFEGGDPEIRAAFRAAVLPEFNSQFVYPALLSLDWGRQTMELVWKKEDLDGEWATTTKSDVPKDPAVHKKDWKDFWTVRYRDLDPVMTRIIADDMGELLGVTSFGADGPIPRKKLIHIVNDQEAGSLFGLSLMRRSYRPWRYAAVSALHFVRYLSTKGNPPYFGRAPNEDVQDPNTASPTREDPMQGMLTGLLNLQGGGVFVAPDDANQDNKQPRYDVKLLETARRAAEFVPGLDVWDRQKFMGLLIPPAITGEAKAYGGSKVAERVFFPAIDQVKHRNIVGPWNEQVGPKMARANFGKVGKKDIPRLVAGAVSENAKEVLAEIVQKSLALAVQNPDGGLTQIASMIDWEWAIGELGMKSSERAMRARLPNPATFPAETGVLPDAGGAPPATAPGAAPAKFPGTSGKPTPTGAPGPGRPAKMTPEQGKPYVPSRRVGLETIIIESDEKWAAGKYERVEGVRVGWDAEKKVIALSRDGVGLAEAPPTEEEQKQREEAEATKQAHQWWRAALLMLDDLDDRMLDTHRISEQAMRGLEADVRGVLTKEFAAAAQKTGSDGLPDLARDSDLASRVQRQIEDVAEKAFQKELLAIEEINAKALEDAGREMSAAEQSAMTPLAAQHAGAFHDAARGAEGMGYPPPGTAAALRVVKAIAKGAKRNAKGVVAREAQRAADKAHGIASSGKGDPSEAMRVAREHKLDEGAYARATEDHVRATARATLAESGESGEAKKWLVALGPRAEKEVIDHAPSGQVAPIAWKTKTADDLDKMYARVNGERGTWSSWRDLGLIHGSPEMYVPLPTNEAAAAKVEALVAERRAQFADAAAASQKRIDATKSDIGREK